jgi:hypothetical protein
MGQRAAHSAKADAHRTVRRAQVMATLDDEKLAA